nr:MAG TPA: hypothetical protein [Caudoviricetes sp.]
MRLSRDNCLILWHLSRERQVALFCGGRFAGSGGWR